MLRLSALLLLLPSAAWADCTNPDGVTGHIVYNTNHQAMQFCNGTDWTLVGTPSPTAPDVGCSSPTGQRGQLIFNSNDLIHQFCNGSQWVATACPDNAAAGTACTGPAGLPGQIATITSGTDAGLFSCTGSTWVQMGVACGAGLSVADVFSVDTYTGTGATKAITNGINLASSGGLVWFKARNGGGSTFRNNLFDTERGPRSILLTDSTAGADMFGTDQMTFNTNGVTIAADGSNYGYNQSGYNTVAWTFRKAPRFFDIVTYTGTGSVRTIAHNLGIAPGMIIIKRIDGVSNWTVYHRSAADTSAGYFVLNTTAGEAFSAGMFNDTLPTSTVFTVGNGTTINTSGGQYIAYLFAHDPAADGKIQCGSYVGDGTTTGPTVTLGWEPQYVLIKNATGTGNWVVLDTARGLSSGSDPQLRPNTTDAEVTSINWLDPLSTGFSLRTNATAANTSGQTYIYCAIRAEGS